MTALAIGSLSAIGAERWDEDDTVACVCGERCLHLLTIEVVQEDFKTVVRRNRHDAMPCGKEPQRRGSIVAIHLGCEECGRRSVLAFQFHKGAVYLFALSDAEPIRADAAPPVFDDELWRD